MIVVDASVALRWVLDERSGAEEDAALQYVVENGGRVPGNFQSEVAHALLQAQRHRRIEPRDVSLALSELLALPLNVALPDPHLVVAIGNEHRLTGYDASYLALAIESGLLLATADEKLSKAARAAAVLWRAPGRQPR